MAIAGIAALASAGGVAAGIVAIETLAIIATVTSVVGAVTGNKTLQKLGMGMGLASAGASLLASAEGAAGAAASTAVDQSAAETARLAAGEATAAAGETAAGNLITQEATGGIVSNATSAFDSSLAGAPDIMGAPSTLAGESATQATSIANAPTAAAVETANATNATANSAFNAGNITTPVDTAANLGVSAPSSPYDMASFGGKDPFGANEILKPKSFFGDTWDKTSAWFEKNPKLGNTLLQVGGNIASGIAKSAEADRLYELQSTQLQMQQQQAANAKSIPTINSMVNPNYVRSGPGIVSNAMGK